MHTTEHALDRHLADCFAEARAFDSKAMQALTDGDPDGAEHCWKIGSLLRISACMLRNNMAVTR